MKKKLISSIILLCSVIGTQAQKPVIYSSPWDWTAISTLSDEFNSTTLSSTKWYDWDPKDSRDIHMLGVTYANAKNVQFGIGSDNLSNVLKLIAKKEVVYSDDNWNPPIKKFNYQSATLKSIAFFRQGYFEIRARIPKTNNNSIGTAFWFWDRNDATGEYSEIDVFETGPTNPNLYPMALHWSSLANTSYEYNQQTCTNITTNITDDFHTYGIDWSSEKIDWYIDGKLIQSYNNIVNQGGSIPVSKLGKMAMILWSLGGYGIEPSKTGNAFEIDYFRYFKRKPNISLDSYDSNTGFWTYSGTTNISDDILTWGYDNTQLSNVTIWNNNLTTYIRFKKNTGTTTLQLNAKQTIVFGDNRNPVTVSAQNSLTIGYDNPAFNIDQPFFANNCLNIKAYAVSSTPGSEWKIGTKKTDGTIDWTNPQKQWGTTATFTNLLSGTTYVIDHGVYNNNVPWNGTQKEITVNYDPDFYINNLKWENNQLNLYTSQISTNPNSEWHIALVKSDGGLDNSVDQAQWGNQAIFKNLKPGYKYQVSHGNYGNDRPWVGTAKVLNIELVSNFEFFDPNSCSCTGKDAELFSENGKLKLRAYSYSANYGSAWYLYLCDDDANYKESDSPIQGPLYGTNVVFDALQNNKIYMIKHGVYDSNGHWTETRKTFRTPSTLKSAFMSEDANAITEISEVMAHDSIFDIKICPNPTSSVIDVKMVGNNNYEEINRYNITNSQGEIIKMGVITNSEQIDLAPFAEGLYFITVYNSQNYVNKKIELKK